MQDNQKQPQKPEQDVTERAHEAARKIGLQREFKRDTDDPADNTSGGFNQKSKADRK